MAGWSQVAGCRLQVAGWARDVIGGVRPSSGAETLQTNVVFEPIVAFGFAEIAVAEDGHTLSNRYGISNSTCNVQPET
jgi:hypothetical protein